MADCTQEARGDARWWHNPCMRAVVQRVSRAEVRVDGEVVGSVGAGLMVLVGVTHSDGADDARAIGRKIATLRIFRDDEDLMNRSVADIDGSVLVVSQFTLYGDVRKGRRPSFVGAARPEIAEPLVELVVETIHQEGVAVETGRFGASMEVSLVNDGPVTIILESADGVVL
jgi:D-aminoacyl-tRNA deacylase